MGSSNPEDRNSLRERVQTDDRVRLLDQDADLAAVIPEDDLPLARCNITTSLLSLVEGSEVPSKPPTSGCAGFLVLDGLLTRDVEFAGRLSRELLGAGDVLRPWDRERDFLPPFSKPSWTVIQPTTLARLDERVLRMGSRWPQLVDELMRRTLHRSRWLAIRLAIASENRVDRRILLFLWALAGRWGKVRPDGVALPFRLTHGLLADLVGARRPSVTTALRGLREAGHVEDICDGWLLRRDASVLGD